MTPTFATVLLDPPTALMFGSLLALASARLIRRAPELEVPRTAAFGAAWGGLYAAAVGRLYFTYPDWMLVYLRDGQTTDLVPSYMGFFFLCVLFGGMSAAAGAAMVARGKWVPAVALLAGSLFTLAACYWLQWDQYIHAGTLEEYLQHRAPLMSQDPRLQRGMSLAGLLSAPPALALLAFRFLRGRRASLGA